MRRQRFDTRKNNVERKFKLEQAKETDNEIAKNLEIFHVKFKVGCHQVILSPIIMKIKKGWHPT